MKYGIYNRPEVPVYLGTCTTEYNNKGELISNVSDEGLYGCSCRILNEEGEWAYIVSSYGYPGYVKQADMILCSEEEVRSWLSDLMLTNAGSTDVLTAPTVHGHCLITLSRGSAVKPLRDKETGEILLTEGWAKVSLTDGREGYVPYVYLSEKRYDDGLLWADPQDLIHRQAHAAEYRMKEVGGDKNFSFADLLDRYFAGDENAFRKELTGIARSYLGTQYRWAGRSSRGIDCSGMVGMSYLMCGVCIYRDASIVRDYPIKRLDLKWTDGKFDLENLEKADLREGDALYFPGHVAMYLGDGLYIHSTAKAGSNGVVINSLRPESEFFRQDLLDSLYAVGGLRK